MEEEPLVSVIIPAYNAEEVLEEALASVQEQTYRNWEAIIVDDGSADSTSRIASRWQDKDKRFILIKHERNRGLPSARNTAISHSNGSFIAFLDSDDVWFPGKLSNQVALFQQHQDATLTYTNYYTWDGQRDTSVRYKRRDKMPEGDLSMRICCSCLYLISTVMVKRELLPDAPVFDPQMVAVEDWDLWIRMGERKLICYGVYEPLMRYRVWVGNMTNNSPGIIRYEILAFEKALARRQSKPRARLCRRQLRRSRSNLPLAQVKPLLGNDTKVVHEALVESLRKNPGNLKRLIWWLACAIPGDTGLRWVESKIRKKW